MFWLLLKSISIAILGQTTWPWGFSTRLHVYQKSALHQTPYQECAQESWNLEEVTVVFSIKNHTKHPANDNTVSGSQKLLPQSPKGIENDHHLRCLGRNGKRHSTSILSKWVLPHPPSKYRKLLLSVFLFSRNGKIKKMQQNGKKTCYIMGFWMFQQHQGFHQAFDIWGKNPLS